MCLCVGTSRSCPEKYRLHASCCTVAAIAVQIRCAITTSLNFNSTSFLSHLLYSLLFIIARTNRVSAPPPITMANLKQRSSPTSNSLKEETSGLPASDSDPLPLYHNDSEGNHVQSDLLKRALSARQVQMIAIGGTIGTGLFLGTGKSLATGGPASMLICYFIVGVIVFVTMLSLGEMAAFLPVAGSFCTFAGRFVDDSFGFALTWNYWFNDAISTASDLVALQLILQYWTDHFPGWALSLIFWFILIGVNIFSVRAYGELEYWLSILKVITICVRYPLLYLPNCDSH